MLWAKSHRADKRALPLADRHYSRQNPGSASFVQPGRCKVFLTPDADALWVTSWPYAKFVKHRWGGAWLCSMFRNEAPEKYLSSDLVRMAVQATLWAYREEGVPELGMITFIDASKTLRKRDPGRCYLKAGFRYVRNERGERERTGSGLYVLQLLPEDMPEPVPCFGDEQGSAWGRKG